MVFGLVIGVIFLVVFIVLYERNHVEVEESKVHFKNGRKIGKKHIQLITLYYNDDGESNSYEIVVKTKFESRITHEGLFYNDSSLVILGDFISKLNYEGPYQIVRKKALFQKEKIVWESKNKLSDKGIWNNIKVGLEKGNK